MSYLIRRVLAKPRLILDEMCSLYEKFASYLRRVLCKTRLIFPLINGPTVHAAVLVTYANYLHEGFVASAVFSSTYLFPQLTILFLTLLI